MTDILPRLSLMLSEGPLAEYEIKHSPGSVEIALRYLDSDGDRCLALGEDKTLDKAFALAMLRLPRDIREWALVEEMKR